MALDTLVPLDFPPGMRNTGTVYQSKNRWYTGNLVRFFGGTIQPIGGWAARTLTGDTITGAPRAMVTYRLNDGTQILVVATVSGLYALVADVVHDITPAAFSSPPYVNCVWQLDVMGTWLVAVAQGTTGLNVPGQAFYWDGDVTGPAVPLDPFDGTDPTRAISTVVTPERFLVMLGGRYTSSGYSVLGKDANDRIVTWATQEEGFGGVGDWTPSATNTAGDFSLSTDGALRCGRRGRGNTLLWTTTDLWTMTYIGGSFVFRFDQVAPNCGIISTRAATVTNVGAFWMGENGFFSYEAFVQPLPCDVQDYVFGSLNRTYAHLIWCLENPAFNEVTWFYPHAAQTDITRYVTYNYAEKHWVTGTLTRTAGVPNQQGVHAFPVMGNLAGAIFNHESGSGRNSEGTPSLESGPMEIGEGDRLVQIQRMLPDDDTAGDVNVTLYSAPNPDTAETTHGPYTISAKTDLRVKARQVRVKLTEVNATSWRVGTIRLGVTPSSRR